MASTRCRVWNRNLACMLARRGIEVIGIDPAAASLDVARRKPGAEHVRWIHGDASSVPPLGVDLAVMTGNVAQVFIGDADWADALRALRSAVRDEGWLVFEKRDPQQRSPTPRRPLIGRPRVARLN